MVVQLQFPEVLPNLMEQFGMTLLTLHCFSYVVAIGWALVSWKMAALSDGKKRTIETELISEYNQRLKDVVEHNAFLFLEISGSRVYRYNKDKTLSWLRLKVNFCSTAFILFLF